MGSETQVEPAGLREMLEAREERWLRRTELSAGGRTVVTVTLCLPLPFRREEFWRSFLREKCTQLEAALTAAGMPLRSEGVLSGADGDAFFYTAEADAFLVKTVCVRLEEEPFGRLIDADVMVRGKAVGRSELALPPRKCFLCGRPAAECVSRAGHAPEEVAAFVRAREEELRR